MAGARAAAVAAALICGLGAANANAAVLRLGVAQDGQFSGCGDQVVQYLADPGERNYVVVGAVHAGFSTAPSCGLFLTPSLPVSESRTGKVRFADLRAPIDAEAPCAVVAGGPERSVATCPAGGYYDTEISTGDGDDTVVVESGTGLNAPIID